LTAEFSIRDATHDDAEAISSIYNAWIDEGHVTMDLDHWSPDSVRQRLDQLDARESLLVIANDRRVVGWGIVKKYSPRRGYRVCCETSLYLDEDYLGKGLGSRLLEALFACCRRHGYRHAVAKINAVNKASIEFHRRHGFELVGIQNEIGYKQGGWWDVAIMQRLFPEVAAPGEDC
jgi:L-amino acid N-acyltransferase YncA